MTKALSTLPPTFTAKTARSLGVHPRDLYAWRDAGDIHELSRGVFRKSDAPAPTYPDLLAVALRTPRAVVCGLSAAVVHDLTDELVPGVQIAVPKGAWVPKIDYPPTTVFRFVLDTFDVGLTTIEAAPGEPVRAYDAARTVVATPKRQDASNNIIRPANANPTHDRASTTNELHPKTLPPTSCVEIRANGDSQLLLVGGSQQRRRNHSSRLARPNLNPAHRKSHPTWGANTHPPACLPDTAVPFGVLATTLHSYYDMSMERVIHGRVVSEAEVNQWVAEAETGYDVEVLKARVGRPARSGEAAQVVPVRLTTKELDALMARAERENLNRSEAIRAALASWTHVA